MEYYSVSDNEVVPYSETASDALASAIVSEDGTIVVTLTDEQYSNIVGESIFTEITFVEALGLFTGSIATGFTLASLVLIIKLGIRAVIRLIQRV